MSSKNERAYDIARAQPINRATRDALEASWKALAELREATRRLTEQNRVLEAALGRKSFRK